MPPSEAARTITRHREALGWSKRRLARGSGMSAAYIVQMENGERPVTPKALARIADAVGLHPYQLLTEAGFIPADHTREAEQMAAEGMKHPEIAGRARPGDTGGALAWLVSDYLMLLGDDPYGLGPDVVPVVACDWSGLAPERWKAMQESGGKITTLASTLDEARQWIANQRKTPTAIEGWDELTDVQRTLVQQLVNQLRRSTDSA